MDTRIIQLLARKLSGEATAEERAELDLLLTRNPEAVYYAELMMQLWDEEKIRTITDTDMSYLRHIARHRPVFTHPAGYVEDVNPEPVHRRRRRLPAALFFVLILAGLYALHQGLFPHKVPAAITRNIEFTAGPGTRRSVILPDGTKVRLNAGSVLRYDPDMLTKDSRDVSLSGEGYFDVAKDRQHVFVIRTDRIAIRVLGTAFNVRAYPQDQSTETTLLQGSVELTVNSKPYQKIILKPREKFALIDDSQYLRPDPRQYAGDAVKNQRLPHARNNERLVVQDIIPVEVEDRQYVREVSWVEDNFVFQNETFGELAPKMERWFNVQIEIHNKQIDGFHFTGIFHKETLSQALQAMQLLKPFKFKITDNHVFIN